MSDQISKFEVMSGLILSIIGGILFATGMYVDNLIIQSHYTLSVQTLAFGAGPLDWEWAGIFAVSFGMVLIGLDLFRNHL